MRITEATIVTWMTMLCAQDLHLRRRTWDERLPPGTPAVLKPPGTAMSLSSRWQTLWFGRYVVGTAGLVLAVVMKSEGGVLRWGWVEHRGQDNRLHRTALHPEGTSLNYNGITKTARKLSSWILLNQKYLPLNHCLSQNFFCSRDDSTSC